MARTMLSKTYLVGIFLAYTPAAFADDSGLYLSASISQSKVDIDRNDLQTRGMIALPTNPAGEPGRSKFDESGHSYSINAGYSFNRFIAIDVGYIKLASANFELEKVPTLQLHPNSGPGWWPTLITSLESNGFTVGGVGSFPVSKRFDTHLSAGVLFARTSIEYSGKLTNSALYSFSASDISTNTKELYFGLGTAFYLKDWRASLDWSRYNNVGDGTTGEASFNNISISLAFLF